MDTLELPQHFLFKGNVSHTWKIWLKQFRFYLTTTEKDNKDGQLKTSMLLTCFDQKIEKSTRYLLSIQLMMK